MPRKCLQCGVSLVDTIGVHIFVTDKTSSTGMRRVDGLLCVEHGGNGQNGMSEAAYDDLVAGQSVSE